MSDNDLILPSNQMVLPFKPFTLGEVKELAGCPSEALDHWVKCGAAPLVVGDDGVTQGLNFMSTLAVFVGWKWMNEGADPARATGVVQLLANTSEGHLTAQLGKGYSFPCPRQAGLSQGIYVHPPRSVLGERLDLKRLYPEFLAKLDRMYPGEKRVPNIPTN